MFFTHPKTVGRDMNRTSWKSDKGKGKVYKKDKSYLRQFDGIRREHENSFSDRDKDFKPPPDPKFVEEMEKKLFRK